VPVDFSEFSRAGAERAVFFAQATGATVSLVHVIHVFPAIPTRHVRNYEHIPGPGEIEQAANAQLREFVKSVKFEGVPHEAVVRTGGAADTICDYADEVSADLIVMTTHGRTGLPHVVIGSVAEHIVRYARCPVLIVPQGERSLRRE
jgi:universal stress protein A